MCLMKHFDGIIKFILQYRCYWYCDSATKEYMVTSSTVSTFTIHAPNTVLPRRNPSISIWDCIWFIFKLSTITRNVLEALILLYLMLLIQCLHVGFIIHKLY